MFIPLNKIIQPPLQQQFLSERAMATNMSKQVAEYEYMVIKKQIKPRKINSIDRLPTFSKNIRNCLNIQNLYSSWKLDQKVKMARTSSTKNFLMPSFLQATTLKHFQDNQFLFWLGNEKRSYLNSILYLLFDNLKSNPHRTFSTQKFVILKGVLYNLAQCYFDNQQKEKFIEGICLLQYHSGPLNDFFLKHQDFLEVCTKLVKALTQIDEKQHQCFQKVASKINQFLENEVKKIFPFVKEVLKVETMMENTDEKDYVLRISILNERTCYILCEKGCLFIYECPQPEKLSNISKTLTTEKKSWARQTVQIQQNTIKMEFNGFDGKKGDQILKDELIRNLFENSNILDSKLENLTRNTDNDSQTLPFKFSKQLERSQSSLQLTNIQQKGLDGLLRHKSQGLIQSIDVSLTEQNLEMISKEDQGKILSSNKKQIQNLNPLTRPMSPTIKKMPPFLAYRKSHNQNQTVQKSRMKGSNREVSPMRVRIISSNKKNPYETPTPTPMLHSPRLKA